MTLFSFNPCYLARADDDLDSDFDEPPPISETTTEPAAEDAPVEGTLTAPDDTLDDANSQAGSLPAIEAKIYNVEIVRPSKSGRVYLIQKETTELPEVGRIFLLKDSATPVMAFRVLKTYPEKNQIAAKRVRLYPGFDQLDPGAKFRAYEKTGDLAAIPNSSFEDDADLMDLEQTPPPNDLQSEPLNEPSNEPAEEPVEDTVDELANEAELATTPDPGEQDLEIREDMTEDEDYTSYDYFPNWLTVPFGVFFGNPHLPGPSPQKGTGLLYGRNMGSRSFTLEGGFYYYKAAGDTFGISKSYTLMPLVGMGRFNFPISENVQFFLYGGVQYKWVIGNLGATNKELQRIAVAAPLAGLGLFVQVGPNWFLKLNLGIDSVLGGIALRF